MVKQRLAQPDANEKGWLLDGYPRSAVQAEALEAQGIYPDVFLLVQVSVSSVAAISSTRSLGVG